MREFFRKYVLHDLGLKLMALTIAFGLWWMVGRDPVVESVETAPIEFHHAPNSLIMTSEGPFEVRVTVSGPERMVRSLNPSEITAVLDLAGVNPGEQTFDLGPKQIHVPRGLTVEQVVPSQIHIDFNPSATRTVEVRPRVIGTFVSGYGITDVTAYPAMIMIEGPQNRVNAIDMAITDPVDATGVVGKATFTTHAYVADPLVRVVHPAPIHVTVTTGKSSRGAGRP
ncbi:MAG TPA: CdaR family protein [Candidatus Eisenbacteria bacterium]|nr:CdaR family protein [Candidatus Eisenbacteria bacterium]